MGKKSKGKASKAKSKDKTKKSKAVLETVLDTSIEIYRKTRPEQNTQILDLKNHIN